MQWIREYKPQPLIKDLYRQALWITVSGNVLLASIKAIVAYTSGSVALYADAANSISDVVYSSLMVVGLLIAMSPPDISHPQGHSRFEPLVGLVVTASMTFAGFEAARASIVRFLAGGLTIDPGLPTIVLLISASLKAVMYILIRNIAKKIFSPTLATTAQDNLSDVLTSIAAFVGVWGSDIIHPLFDPIAGIIVSLWIFRAAFNAAKDNLGFLTGAGAPQELREKIVKAAESVPGVLKVHHTMTEYVGPKLVVDIHINVDGNLSLNKAHEISDLVNRKLEEIPDVDRAYIHVEPEGWEEK